ncbi:acyl-CoA dehydrogenase family protein [Vibrio europaeus]|uniref:acyl-CoA dehydrogenase family protein n=1 Tax=Vibrio europaeus TaxID=300876 RepID=UPI0023425906|nr:acyl-CoA dehydrogenase family protein [Vibrio europaeus]MDC5848280.1 acyl-CoA dehydrogenase family protein [Vibrio europaeus]
MNITQAMIEQAFQAGRHAQLEEVLPRLIHCATEHSAQGLAYQGFALTKTNEGAGHPQVVDLNGQAVAESRLTWLAPDRLLDWLNLQVATVSDQQALCLPISTLIASARLGLVARTLDYAHQHLQNRKSFGQKTTRHQLIKASFSDIYGDVTLLNQQLSLRVENTDHQGLETEHQAITRLSNQAEKLMGGHGFLMGATHTVSHLSMLLYSVFGKQPSTEAV